MIIYIDNDYKCHSQDDGTMREFDVEFFNGKCPTFINGYRYVPSGETWTREDGVEFKGEMVAPWVDYRILAEAQRNYEDGIDSMDSTVAELMDDIEELCNELIGE